MHAISFYPDVRLEGELIIQLHANLSTEIFSSARLICFHQAGWDNCSHLIDQQILVAISSPDHFHPPSLINHHRRWEGAAIVGHHL